MTQLPLRGQRILVTRAKEQAGFLAEKLRSLGAEPLEFPTIAIAPLEDFQLLDHAIQRLTASQYDWTIFTSVNGVRSFFERVRALGYDPHQFSAVKRAAIGPATAAALDRHGLSADYVPQRYLAEEIAAGIGNVRGQRILLPRADIARRYLAEALRAKGAIVEEVASYRTLPADSEATRLQTLLCRGEIDLITFTSASTVRHFAQLLDGLDLRQAVGNAKIACIGPVTAQAAEALGLEVKILAEEHTIEGLVRAITLGDRESCVR